MAAFNLSFHTFPQVWGVMNMGAFPLGDVVVYRSAQTRPNNQTQPRWFGGIQTASGYVNRNENYALYKCVLNRNVRLIDIRCLKWFLLEVMQQYPVSNTTIKSKYEKIMAVLGLLPHDKQQDIILRNSSAEGFIRTLDIDNRMPRREPFHYIGSRLSWGAYDDVMAEFAKEILGGRIDGYIAPMLPMADGYPFHAELCLFNPSESLSSVSTVNTVNTSTLNDMRTVSITDMFQYNGFTGALIQHMNAKQPTPNQLNAVRNVSMHTRAFGNVSMRTPNGNTRANGPVGMMARALGNASMNTRGGGSKKKCVPKVAKKGAPITGRTKSNAATTIQPEKTQQPRTQKAPTRRNNKPKST